MIRTIGTAAVGLASILWLVACEPAGAAHPDPPSAAPAVDAGRSHAAPPRTGTAYAEYPEAALPKVVSAEPVAGYRGPGDRPFSVALRSVPTSLPQSATFGSLTRPIGLRTAAADLGQYPCSSCHLEGGTLLDRERHRDAHQNVQPVHPERTGTTCGTCHAAENVERLALRGGGRVALDHAYRLCGECHFQQATAWAAGAHGKRLEGWQGERVVMGCAECHDPHRPALERRIPFRPPRIARSTRIHP